MYPDNQVYKYIDQLEKRVLEQEQLIALLNEKILSLKSTPQVNQPNAADVRSPTSCNVPPRDQNMDQMSFVGTRKSDVPSVTTTKYNQYFVSRVKTNNDHILCRNASDDTLLLPDVTTSSLILIVAKTT
ncbi:hypothetical protein M8J75_007016 [Diaphorina citri]|nr:hypothetical protein M8J75_007016 [Diaphorina citri]